MVDDIRNGIKIRLTESISEHSTRLDAWAYNSLTVVSLMGTGFAAAAAGHDGIAPGWVALASAVAALCIAVERALGLGARWRFHSEMRAAYRTMLDGLDFQELLPDERREAFVTDWWSKLLILRSREAQIPNSGGDGK
jgi:hypothetical protein